jgi:hypothetical protein
VLLPCLCETLEVCAGFLDGTDLCVKDDWRRRCVTHPRREPAPVGRAPIGLAGVSAIVSEPTGVEAQLGVLAITEGLFTRPGEITKRFICHGGDLDGSEIPRAGQSGPLHRVPTVGCDPVAGLLGNQRGGDHPAVVTLFAEIPVEPVATGAGCVDEAQMWSLRWHRTDEVITITLAGPNGSHVGHLGAMILSPRGHSDRIRVDIHAHEACARRRHG